MARFTIQEPSIGCGQILRARIGRSLMLMSFSVLLAGCLGSKTPDLSGSWENDVVGTLELTQLGNTLSAEQKDPDYKAYFGPKMFEGTLVDGVLTGKVATALPMNTRQICGQNWGRWADIELRLAPDGLALEGKWVRMTNNVKISGCPIINTEWAPFQLTRTAGQPPVQIDVIPRWIPVLVLVGGLLIGAGFRYALVLYLVGSMKRSPNSASAAGWALLTAFMTASASLSALLWGASLGSALVWGPLAGISLLSLVAALIMSRKH